MGAMKQYAEEVSVDMGFEGEVNDEVLAEAQRRLERQTFHGMDEITGQLFFRDAAGEDSNGRPFRTQDGRKLMTVFGIIAVPEDTVIKAEHQHTVVGNTAFLAISPEAIDRTEFAKGYSIDRLLAQAIWRH